MTLPRTPEPIADPGAESDLYRQMDHERVNAQFVTDFISGGPVGPRVIDLGCGPAAIPIKLVAAMPEIQVMGIDSEPEMLAIAREEIDFEGMIGKITLECADASDLVDFEDEMADSVMSNTFLHHLDEPTLGMQEAHRILKTGGRLFIRDLYRPEDNDQIEQLVDLHASTESEAAKQMLRQSLHAALTLDEITTIANDLGMPSDCIRMTSDRHWTIDWTNRRRPDE